MGAHVSFDLAAVEAQLRTQFVGRRIDYLACTDSTMNVARAEAERGAAEGTVILAEEQTAGRGRFDRTWVSPAGKNIYLTLIMRPPLERLRSLSVVAPLAVCLALEEMTGLGPRIKWPNDVRVGGRKISGILIESEVSGQTVRYALVGPGVNVNFDIEESSEIADSATSIKSELGYETSREELLAAFLNHFEAAYRRASSTQILDAWRSRLDTLGRQIRVTFRDQSLEGVAEDVDADGSLLLRTADGSLTTVDAGEVTLRG